MYVDPPLAIARAFALPPAAARHVQVLRLQPGQTLVLFDGRGGEWDATVRRIGRHEVQVDIDAHRDVERELALAVTLAVCMPANERMDPLVEKATELGVAEIQPLLAQRSVLRLTGERAQRRVAHWQAVAAAASEQSGRTRVPRVHDVRPLAEWLDRPPPGARWLLSLGDATPLGALQTPGDALVVLAGPEGGFSAAEEQHAREAAFLAVSLGERTLRADTAPLAALAFVALQAAARPR